MEWKLGVMVRQTRKLLGAVLGGSVAALLASGMLLMTVGILGTLTSGSLLMSKALLELARHVFPRRT